MALDLGAEILRDEKELVRPRLREEFSYDIFRAPVHGHGIIDKKYMEAYKDILENLDELAGISFYGGNRFEYFQAIVPKLRNEFERHLLQRELPLEVRIDPRENHSIIGDCSFDSDLGLWKQSNIKNDSNSIFYGSNSDYYESMNKGISYRNGPLVFSSCK